MLQRRLSYFAAVAGAHRRASGEPKKSKSDKPESDQKKRSDEMKEPKKQPANSDNAPQRSDKPKDSRPPSQRIY